MTSRRPLRIAITCYPVPGGSGILATELGAKLAMRGHEVHFISHALPYRLDRFKTELYYHEVETPDYPLFKYPPYTLSLASKMIEVSQQFGLDVLHVHYALPFAISAYLAKQSMREGAPKTLCTLHGTDITLVGSDRSFYEITRFSIDAVDGVTAVSEYLRNKTISVFGTSRPIDVIRNFVDTDRFYARPAGVCRHKYAPEGEKVVAHLSNFRAVKNIPGVIHMFARLRQRLPAKLLLIGDGPQTAEAFSLAKSLDVAADVKFLGNREDVDEILCAADAFLLPSHYEAFGLAALEAMACGVPVVASKVGGVPELIQDGKTGFLVGPDEYDAGGERLFQILTNPELAGRLRENGLKSVKDNFTADAVVPLYEDVYYRLIQEGK
ncbi:MAG: N-acetyl-alpha-D-glucosaminyl L-malate synthase BshA [candidate division Zixibacteria bacterium]|nr:N-acetyl-alpha-D-glucosaminyl L-malate synthase BshA [candidate division Zixibacteria bacterium]